MIFYLLNYNKSIYYKSKNKKTVWYLKIFKYFNIAFYIELGV